MRKLAPVLARITAALTILVLCVALAPAETVHKRSQKRSTHTSAKKSGAHRASSNSRKGKKAGKTIRARGQQGIDPARTREIQAALIREHYLDGEPTGVWDQRTKEAITRFQADHGWQTKVLPDSRALIKLGLGPTHEGAINMDRTSIDHPLSGGESDVGAPVATR